MLSKSKKGDFVLSHVCSYAKAAFYFDFYLRKTCLMDGGRNNFRSNVQTTNWMLSIIKLLGSNMDTHQKKETLKIETLEINGWKTSFWDGLIFTMRQTCENWIYTVCCFNFCGVFWWIDCLDEIEIIIAFTYCFLLWGSPKPTTFDKRRVY